MFRINCISKRLIYLLIIGLAFSFTPKKNKNIIWDAKRKLEFSDFKAKPNAKSSYEALSAVGINGEFSYDADILKFHVYSFFKPQESWTKRKNDPYILNHEQRHFDISEINARRFRKALLENKWSSDPKKISKDFNRLFQEHLKQENADQIAYDEVSNHSINKESQEIWNDKIDEELKALKGFDRPAILIQL